MPAQQPFLRFSTHDIPAHRRLDCYMDVLQRSLWPVSDWHGLPAEFYIDMRAEKLGCLTAVTQNICAHHSHRTRADVERSAERSYHMFVSTGAAWAFTHRGRHERLEVGDVVIIGEGEHETHAPQGFEGMIVKCPEHWIQTWLPDPEAIAGHRIAGDSTWGRVLSPALRRLTPEYIATTPLPADALSDQVGAMLSLLAGDLEAREARETRAWLARVRDCIRQRCAEPALVAQDVALTLGVPVQVLHRALSAEKTTFAAELSRARKALRLSMPSR